MCKNLRQFQKNQQDECGFSLIEVVLAVAVFLVMIVFVFDSQWSIGDLFKNNERILRAIREVEYEMWNLGQPPAVERPFSKCFGRLEIQKSWFTGWRTQGQLRMSILETDLTRADQFGLDCGGQASIPPEERISQGSNSVIDTDAAVSSVDIFDGNTFLSLDSTSGSIPDEQADIGSVASNGEIQFFDFGPAINKIDVAHIAADNYIFAANKSTTTQFSIIRIGQESSNGALNLTLVATSSLPGVAGVRPEAVSVFYSNPYVVIGTKRTAGRELHLFDVSDPQHPTWVGSREMNHNINDIFVADSLAFLATSGNVRDLIVLDISDPSHITQLAAIDLSGNEDGRSITISGHYIFLGRHKATVPGHDELVMLRYEIDPNTREISIETLDSIGTAGDVTSISIHDGRVLAATKSPLKELQIFGFDSSNAHSLLRLADIDLPANSLGIDADGDSYAVTSGQEIIQY